MKTALRHELKEAEQNITKVTGGHKCLTYSLMRCRSCGYFEGWEGDHAGRPYDCPSCGKYTFWAISTG